MINHQRPPISTPHFRLGCLAVEEPKLAKRRGKLPARKIGNTSRQFRKALMPFAFRILPAFPSTALVTCLEQWVVDWIPNQKCNDGFGNDVTSFILRIRTAMLGLLAQACPKDDELATAARLSSASQSWVVALAPRRERRR